MIRIWVCAGLLSVCCALPVSAQQPAPAAGSAIVPQLVNFSGPGELRAAGSHARQPEGHPGGPVETSLA
jgi:hypothetical protein